MMPAKHDNNLATVVAHNKTGGLFLNGPGRREAACGHSLACQKQEEPGSGASG